MITVTSTADSGAGTLRAALAAAAIGETINFAVTGTITLTSAELVINQNQIIAGPGSSVLTIKRGSGTFRIFNVNNGIVTISGLRITDGNGNDGGGLFNQATLTISDLIFYNNNTGTNGGAINNLSTIHASDIVVVNNTSTGDGGGIFNDGTYTGSTSVTNNTAGGKGGGVWNDGDYEVMGDITGNTSTGLGGGVYNNGTWEIIDSTLSGNTGTGQGDGLYNDTTTATVTRSAVSGHPNGSALYNNFGSLTVADSTLSGNFTGVLNNQGALVLTNATVTQNGRGVTDNPTSSVSVFDTILAGNTIMDIVCLTIEVTSLGHNLFGHSTNPITPAAGDRFGLTFAALKLGPLQNNGGPSFTHALLTGSPAIDAGDNTGAPLTDQRGSARIQNNTIDIGAYESCVLSPTPTPVSDNSQPPVGCCGDRASQWNLAASLLKTLTASGPTPPPVPCANPTCPSLAPDFAPITQHLTINGSTTSPNRGGGFFNKLTTFNGVAGQRVQFWMRSQTFDSYLYLMSPSNVVIAQQDSLGYNDNGFVDNSAILIVLPVTGTYTLDCTTFSAGDTGDFDMVIVPGPVAAAVCGTNTNNFVRDLLYIPSVNRIYAFNQLGNSTTDKQVFVINPCMPVMLNSFTLPNTGTNPLANAYNSVTGFIYLVDGDGDLLKLDPATNAFTTAVPAITAQNTDNGIAFDPVNNRLYVGLNTNNIAVVDCSTDTVVHTVPIGNVGMAYADNGFIYVASGGTIHKINTTTYAVSDTGIGCVAGIWSILEKKLLVSNDASNRVQFIDYVNDTVINSIFGVSNSLGAEFAVWNPTAKRIYISLFGSGTFYFGVATYDPVSQSVDTFVNNFESEGLVYVPQSSCVFAASRSPAIVYKLSQQIN